MSNTTAGATQPLKSPAQLHRAAALLHRPDWLVFARRFSSLEPPPKKEGIGLGKRPENSIEPN
jgi:hypothetical protein